MSLNGGKSLEGQLQYIVYYSEQQKDWDKSEMAPNQWPHESEQILGWETISQGSLTNPLIDLTSLITIAIITASLICSGILILIVMKKRVKK